MQQKRFYYLCDHMVSSAALMEHQLCLSPVHLFMVQLISLKRLLTAPVLRIDWFVTACTVLAAIIIAVCFFLIQNRGLWPECWSYWYVEVFLCFCVMILVCTVDYCTPAALLNLLCFVYCRFAPDCLAGLQCVSADMWLHCAYTHVRYQYRFPGSSFCFSN